MWISCILSLFSRLSGRRWMLKISGQFSHRGQHFSPRSSAEQNYDASDCELALLEGTEQPFAVWTDRKNLKYLKPAKRLNSFLLCLIFPFLIILGQRIIIQMLYWDCFRLTLTLRWALLSCLPPVSWEQLFGRLKAEWNRLIKRSLFQREFPLTNQIICTTWASFKG